MGCSGKAVLFIAQQGRFYTKSTGCSRFPDMTCVCFNKTQIVVQDKEIGAAMWHRSPGEPQPANSSLSGL
jgi:hypothetical protein